jgi:hypothetical protein
VRGTGLVPLTALDHGRTGTAVSTEPVVTLPAWPELLASALVGTERRPVHNGLSTVDDPVAALLDAAAALTAYLARGRTRQERPRPAGRGGG